MALLPAWLTIEPRKIINHIKHLTLRSWKTISSPGHKNLTVNTVGLCWNSCIDMITFTKDIDSSDLSVTSKQEVLQHSAKLSCWILASVKVQNQSLPACKFDSGSIVYMLLKLCSHGCGKINTQSIDIQTSAWDWSHPVFRAGSLLLEAIVSSNSLYKRLFLLLWLCAVSGLIYSTILPFWKGVTMIRWMRLYCSQWLAWDDSNPGYLPVYSKLHDGCQNKKKLS